MDEFFFSLSFHVDEFYNPFASEIVVLYFSLGTNLFFQTQIEVYFSCFFSKETHAIK